MDALQQRLAQIIMRFWRVPPKEGVVLLKTLLRSPCERAKTMRQHLSLAEAVVMTPNGYQQTDLRHLFTHVLTPRFMMDLCTDLHATGSLTRSQVVTIEECILEAVSAQGTWKVVK